MIVCISIDSLLVTYTPIESEEPTERAQQYALTKLKYYILLGCLYYLMKDTCRGVQYNDYFDFLGRKPSAFRILTIDFVNSTTDSTYDYMSISEQKLLGQQQTVTDNLP